MCAPTDMRNEHKLVRPVIRCNFEADQLGAQPWLPPVGRSYQTGRFSSSSEVSMRPLFAPVVCVRRSTASTRARSSKTHLSSVQERRRAPMLQHPMETQDNGSRCDRLFQARSLRLPHPSGRRANESG